MNKNLPLISIAPMMDWTDRHDRYFLRLISKRVLLYTEMITTNALLRGDREYLLDFDASEHPLVLQLGGNNPKDLATCTQLAIDHGYDAVNLNVGCPSDRVQSACFGAALMADPTLVARCVEAMTAVGSIPISVKTRIGIDDDDPEVVLPNFIKTVADAGCQNFIIHARKAWLKGLNPKQNREVPPLCYDLVYQLKKDFPELAISLNGGVSNLEQVAEHLQFVDGVMLGRAAYHNPFLLIDIDPQFFGESEEKKTRDQILSEFLPYIAKQLRSGVRLSHMTRHILGLFQGLPGARAWRRHISEKANRFGADLSVVIEAAERVGCSVSL